MSYYSKYAPVLFLGANSIIKSIYRGSITITAGNTVATAALPAAVDLDKTVIFWNGRTSDRTANIQVQFAGGILDFSNSSTIRATRPGTTNSVTIYYIVVEFQSFAVGKVQLGNISISGTSNTATLSPTFDTSRSAVFYLGHTSTGSTGAQLNNEYPTLALTSSSVVTAQREGSSGGVQVGYMVVEFAAGILKSAPQQVVGVVNAVATPVDVTLGTAVNPDLCLLVHNGWRSAGTGQSLANSPYWRLLNGTTVRFEKSAGNAVNITCHTTVLEFQPQYIKRACQRGVINIGTAQTQNDAAITAVDMSKAIDCYCNSGVTATNQSTTMSMSAIFLQDSANVRAIRNATTGEINASYEVLEFK